MRGKHLKNIFKNPYKLLNPHPQIKTILLKPRLISIIFLLYLSST